MLIRMNHLTDNEVAEIAAPILRSRFGPYGFEQVDVREEEDFAGVNIIRMLAKVQEYVPARTVIDTTDERRVELLGRGDDRLVFLAPRTNDLELVGEDDDVD